MKKEIDIEELRTVYKDHHILFGINHDVFDEYYYEICDMLAVAANYGRTGITTQYFPSLAIATAIKNKLEEDGFEVFMDLRYGNSLTISFAESK